MKHIRFLPWVGKTYTLGIQGKRVLVLGESHYCADPAEAIPTITQDVIQDLLRPDREHEGYMNTYTKFERALSGQDLSPRDRPLWWNKVIFYNYVQFPISGARQAPSLQEFQSSEVAFFELLETYRPDLILVWGQRLYDNLPSTHWINESPFTLGDKTTERGRYRLPNGHIAHVLRLTHPSAAFSPTDWHLLIKAYLQTL